MSATREVTTFSHHGAPNWRCVMTQNYFGSRGAFLQDLLFTKCSDSNKKIVEVRLGDYAIYEGAIDSHSATMCKLDDAAAKSLRNWLIEQYPLELTELALLKTKKESDQ